LAGRVMLTGAFLYLPLVFMPETDSLNAPALNPLRRVYFICKYFYKNNAHTQHKTKSITDKKGA
ncbi:hypothetical protein U4Z27_21470, partial [Escherichia coli]|nr:hypothetical protein [Escherichia coli]